MLSPNCAGSVARWPTQTRCWGPVQAHDCYTGAGVGEDGQGGLRQGGPEVPSFLLKMIMLESRIQLMGQAK